MNTSWFVLHPKVVAGAVGGAALAALTSVLASQGHPMPQEVAAALTAAGGAFAAWLLPSS